MCSVEKLLRLAGTSSHPGKEDRIRARKPNQIQELHLENYKVMDICNTNLLYTPDICHFLYMGRIFRVKFLHTKIPKIPQKE